MSKFGFELFKLKTSDQCDIVLPTFGGAVSVFDLLPVTRCMKCTTSTDLAGITIRYKNLCNSAAWACSVVWGGGLRSRGKD